LTTFTGPSAEWSCYGCTVTSNADGTAVVISESEAVHLYTAAPEDSDGDGILDDADACPAQAPALGLDADANGCTDTIGGLTALVQSVPLTPNIRRGLMAKLDDAGKAIDRGHTAAAVNKVQEFISQVRAQSGKAITTANADLLTSYATNLIALLQT